MNELIAYLCDLAQSGLYPLLRGPQERGVVHRGITPAELDTQTAFPYRNAILIPIADHLRGIFASSQFQQPARTEIQIQIEITVT